MGSRILIFTLFAAAHLLGVIQAPEKLAPLVAASVYGPLAVFQGLGFPVFLQAESGGWSAPSFLGWLIVLLVWSIVWWAAASFFACLFAKRRTDA